MSKNQDVVQYPCLIDLHLHLDGSLSVESIKKLAALQNIELNMTDEEIKTELSVSEDCRDLNEYLTKFKFPNIYLQTETGIENSVYNLLEELKEQGHIYAEIRFAPQLSTEKGLTQEEVVSAAIRGLKRSDLQGGLILCFMKGDGTHDKNFETLRIAEKYLGKGVVAVDIAGADMPGSTNTYDDLFVATKEKGIPYTIHAGEAEGPESVELALGMGAQRIGHGVRAVESEATLDRLVKEGITLETCPTSNLNTQAIGNINDYPYRKFVEKEVKFIIDTDNTSVSCTNLNHEYNIIAETFKLSYEDVGRILITAANSIFADDSVKEFLKTQIIEAYNLN